MPQNCSHSIMISHTEVLQKRTACFSTHLSTGWLHCFPKGTNLQLTHNPGAASTLTAGTSCTPAHPHCLPGLSVPANPELLILPARQEPPPPPNRENHAEEFTVFKIPAQKERGPWPTFLTAKLQHAGITDLQANQQFVRNSSHQERQIRTTMLTKLDTVSF